ncbi:MAG: Rieske (2Fe-2S) protein [Chloroflexota bacterium]
MAKHKVATVEEILPGERKVLTIAGRSIGVFNIDGEFFAIRNSCPHQGGPLCVGRLTGFVISRIPGEYEYNRKDEILKCVWHGWEFDVKTGQSWVDPERTRVRTYAVSVETMPGEEMQAVSEIDEQTGKVPGPYAAETYDVTVEEQVVFVDI